MLNKLRKKIISMNMGLVGIVLISVCVLVCINVYNVQLSAVEHALRQTLAGHLPNIPRPDFTAPYLPDHSDSSDDYSERSQRRITASALVFINPDMAGSYTTTQNSLALENSIIDSAVQAALACDRDMAALDDYNLYYLKDVDSDSNTIKIAFVDSSSLKNALKKVVIWSIVLVLGGLIFIFFISLLLSGLAIKPIRLAWRQQQRFMADASHELKTPLTVILANNNILLAHPDDLIKNQKKWLASTQEEAQHMGNLINDMLFLAKSDEGNPLVLADVNFSDICESDVLQFEPVAFERGLTLGSSVEPGIILRGDNTQLNQLVHIFLDNACKYTPSGGTLFLSLSRSSGIVRLVVSNSGKPIPAESLPHLFDRFYRIDSSRTKNSMAGGFGLGLSIAKTIAEKNGGAIHVESTAEKGTVFSVIFK